MIISGSDNKIINLWKKAPGSLYKTLKDHRSNDKKIK